MGWAKRLRNRGVSVEERSYSAHRYGAVTSVLYALLRDRLLNLPDDPELIDELANVRLVETLPGIVRVEHDAGRHEDRVMRESPDIFLGLGPKARIIGSPLN
jgi:hypothetical protein